MAARTWQAIALLLLLGPTSLAGKLVTLDLPGPTPAASLSLSGNVAAILAAHGYERVGNRRMINSPAYAVEVYRDGRRPVRCDGVVYLMPMATNAEAVTLLAHPGTLPVVDTFFVFQGTIVEAFPSYSQWLARLTGRINGLFRHHRHVPPVYGVATTADCMRPRTLPWSRLVDCSISSTEGGGARPCLQGRTNSPADSRSLS